MRRNATFILLLALMSMFVLQLHAAEDNAQKDAEASETEELHISADRMEMQLDGKTIELSGNVKIEDSTMNLTALKMMVYLEEDKDARKDKEEDTPTGKMKLKHLDADGEVILRKLDGTESAMSDHAAYDVTDDTIIMTGNCSIVHGNNSMRGEKVMYDRAKKKIELKRASITIPLSRKSKNGLGNMFNNNKAKKDDDTKKEEALQDKP